MRELELKFSLPLSLQDSLARENGADRIERVWSQRQRRCGQRRVIVWRRRRRDRERGLLASRSRGLFVSV
jgi:hypothetical protein